MNCDLYDILLNAGFYRIFYYSCLLLSAAISLFFLHKVEPAFKWLAILILITLVSESTAKYIAYCLHQHNTEVYHFFTPLEYIIYVIIFLHFLEQPRWKLLIWMSAIGFILLEIVNTIYFQPLEETNTNTILMENLLLVFLSLLLFLRIREAPLRQDLHLEGVFWFNSGVLCFYSINILISGLQGMKVYLLANPPLIIDDINKILSGLLYISFLVAILLSAFKRKQIQLQHD